jgi:hypothetical protein
VNALCLCQVPVVVNRTGWHCAARTPQTFQQFAGVCAYSVHTNMARTKRIWNGRKGKGTQVKESGSSSSARPTICVGTRIDHPAVSCCKRPASKSGPQPVDHPQRPTKQAKHNATLEKIGAHLAQAGVSVTVNPLRTKCDGVIVMLCWLQFGGQGRARHSINSHAS